MSTSRLYIVLPILVAGLATLWALWPEKYVAWVQLLKRKMPPSMRAGAERVDAVFSLSSAKPWYPKYLRVIGIVIWLVLLSFAYMVYKF
jgi:hypothetical protein